MTITNVTKQLDKMGASYFFPRPGKVVAMHNGFDIEFDGNGFIAVKRASDESDPTSDYCAWSFYHKIKDLTEATK